MAGINGTEFVVIALVILVVVGPEKLPELAAQLGRVIREVKAIATGAKERVEAEFGPDIEELKSLDPRQYDPRRIVRDALKDDPPPSRAPRRTPAPPGRVAPPAATAVAASGVAATGAPPAEAGTPPTGGPTGQELAEATSELTSGTPFDDEAT